MKTINYKPMSRFVIEAEWPGVFSIHRNYTIQASNKNFAFQDLPTAKKFGLVMLDLKLIVSLTIY